MMVAPHLEASASAGIEIENIDTDIDQISVVCYGKTLRVRGANGLVLKIYNVTGQIQLSVKIDSNDKRIDLPLPNSCYIAKVGNGFTRAFYIRSK